ncbi:MAG: thiosulfate oxidation carrier protein SoxY [Methylococcaceae bacterium]|jgi:sulfur-oxidizing protein SoxY
MNVNRREFIKKSLTLSAYTATSPLLFSGRLAQADWVPENFAPSILDETLRRLFNESKIIETDKIYLQLPKTAEKGAAIAITVTSSIVGVSKISILVEQNLVPLAACFELSPELDGYVTARLNIEKTSYVFAIVETQNHIYSSPKATVKIAAASC